MTEQRSRGKVWIAAVAAVVLAGAAGVWAYSTHRSAPTEPTVAVPDEFSLVQLKLAAAEDPGRMWERMREVRDRIDLTDAQREQIGDNMREAMEEQMRKRMDEYFNAPPEEQEAILDRHIDEMETRRREFEQRREEQEQRDASNPEERQRDEQRWRERREEWRRRMADPQERKERSETRNPNERARRMAYREALDKRMQQRGIEPPRWGRGPDGGGRGPGGGWGGPRP